MGSENTVTFSMLPIGERFHWNGSEYIKETQDLAKVLQSEAQRAEQFFEPTATRFDRSEVISCTRGKPDMGA